jgi:uncharacterized protein (TIGR02996 family)
MNPPRELLAAIAADPDAAAPRLAAAEWFAANGDPERAEFIRLQLEVGAALRDERDSLDTDFEYGYRREAAAALDRHDLLPKIAREYDLLAANERRWVPLPGKSPPFRGGFPTSLKIPVEEFLARPELTDLAPGETVHLTEFAARLPQPRVDVKSLTTLDGLQAFLRAPKFADRMPGVQAVAASPHLTRAERLDLSHNELNGEHLAALLASPHLAELRSLNLGSNKVGPTGAKAIAGCARLSRLEFLSLWFNDIGPEGAAALAASPHLSSLKNLELYANNLGDRGVIALAESPALARLTRLSIGYNQFTPAAVERLACSRHLTNLTNLSVSGNKGFGGLGLAILARSAVAPRLTRLNLGCCGLTAADTRHLNTPAFANLRELSLKGEDKFPDRVGASALGGSPHLAGLQFLWLERVRLGDDGLAALASGPGAASLLTLAIQENGITARGVRALAGAEKFRTLRTLHMRKNNIGPGGAAALAESPHLHGLRKVDLTQCGLGEEGMLALLRAPWMAKVVDFDFGCNKLGDRFVIELARQPFLANFISLDLGLNRVGDEGIIALANSPHLAGLRKLSLGSNRIGDAGCRALAGSPHLNKLEWLIMTDNPNTTAAGRLPLWERFERPGCRFVFGYRKRAEDERGDPEPQQPRDGIRD